MRLGLKLLGVTTLTVGLLWAGRVSGQNTLITPRDCVDIKSIAELVLSPNGKQLAYLVKAPDVVHDQNNYRLYVKGIDDESMSPGKLVLSGVGMMNIRWLGDNKRIALLIVVNDVTSVMLIDSLTGKQSQLSKVGQEVMAFSIDSAGVAVAYKVATSKPHEHLINSRSAEDIARGYRIDHEEKTGGGWPLAAIYLRRMGSTGAWSEPRAISIRNPFTRANAVDIPYPRYLSLAPDGKHLFLSFMSDVPKSWKTDPYIKSFFYASSQDTLLEIMCIYDVDQGTTELALKSVNVHSDPVWSGDSRSFFLNVHSPVGSSYEERDIRENHTSIVDASLFEVTIETGEVTEVLPHVSPFFYAQGPLFETSAGDLMVRKSADAILRFRKTANRWSEIDRLALPQKADDHLSLLSTNGENIFGVQETVTTPENLFSYSPGQGAIRLLTELNPQIAERKFAPVQQLSWSTDDGLDLNGILFLPPNYVPGRRYPLVIQTKGNSGSFVCDSGQEEVSSFAPQPLASAGIMYLIRSTKNGYNYQQELDKRPRAYPGGIGEPVQEMEIWDSAVKTLTERGMVDPSKVGIIGYSRTGFEVLFDLVHAKTRYAAATAADSAQYSLSEYWLLPWFASDAERMYGGPPYGATLANWQKYSVSYNIDKIHTPLLMEEMGEGIHDDVDGVTVLNLATRSEISKGLTRLGRPVELYFYPDGHHYPFDLPQSRLASLERNVDWYRFWLQGYESDELSKRQQYERWRGLRTIQSGAPPPSPPQARFNLRSSILK